MSVYVGIDFGTTNSAIAIARDAGAAELLRFPSPGGGTQDTWRTVLFFEHGDGPQPQVSAGSLAIDRYLDSGGDGRFIQSAKSHLASKLFSKTSILSRNYGLEDLVSTYLLQMREAVDVDLGDTAVVGRPVRYWGAEDEEDDARAISRMRAGLAQAGFTKVIFENESNAAAAKYAVGLDCEELVLTADFGGGTSDFCLMRIAPGGRSEILSVGGIGIGGDTFDGAIVDALVAPLLGKGSEYSDGFGGMVEVPRSLYSNLRRWHHLAFLKSRKTMALLERVHSGADKPECIERFIHLVEADAGLPLHRSIESTKVTLSSDANAELDFRDPPVHIHAPVERRDFEEWIDGDLVRIDEVVSQVLADAGVDASDVQRVFTTGGSSFVPAVRQRLEASFPGKLKGGEEMTSVALGLAERARQEFASR